MSGAISTLLASTLVNQETACCEDCGAEITEAEYTTQGGLCWHCMWATANL